MQRRELLKLALAGAISRRGLAQGREFRKNPAPAPPSSRRIIDLHVHPLFQK